MLGIIGGMGPKATARLYLSLTERFSQTDRHDLPECMIHSVAMTRRIEDAFLTGRAGPTSPELATVRRLLDDAVRRLLDAGATHIVMPCNTLQDELARICRTRGAAHIDMVEATVKAIADAGARRVLVLATTSTCRADVYGRHLRRHGIECTYPSEREQAWIEDHIRGALDLRPQGGLSELLHDYVEACDGIVLGCTDLTSELGSSPIAAPIFDSLECLAIASIGAQPRDSTLSRPGPRLAPPTRATR